MTGLRFVPFLLWESTSCFDCILWIFRDLRWVSLLLCVDAQQNVCAGGKPGGTTNVITFTSITFKSITGEIAPARVLPSSASGMPSCVVRYIRHTFRFSLKDVCTTFWVLTFITFEALPRLGLQCVIPAQISVCSSNAHSTLFLITSTHRPLYTQPEPKLKEPEREKPPVREVPAKEVPVLYLSVL